MATDKTDLGNNARDAFDALDDRDTQPQNDTCGLDIVVPIWDDEDETLPDNDEGAHPDADAAVADAGDTPAVKAPAEAESEPEAEAQPVEASSADDEPAADAEDEAAPEAEVEPTAEAEPEPELADEPEPVHEPEPEPEAEPVPEPEAALELEAALEPEAEPEAKPEPQDAPEPSPEPVAALVPQPTPTLTATMKFPEPTEAPDASADQGPAASLGDVGATFASWAHGRTQAVGSWFAAHRMTAVLAALACVAAALVAVLMGMRMANTPSDELIHADARTHLVAPDYTRSDFASDDPLVLQSVEIAEKRTSGRTADSCDVELLATFSNGSMESQADATLTYTRSGDDWTFGGATTGKASHHATAGVDHDKVLDEVSQLLRAADSDDGRESLETLYRSAEVEITDEQFDEDGQTDVLTLHCSRVATFISYECDLTARFRFAAASGAWEMAGVQASDGAKDLGLKPLVGTWQGTFISQTSRSGKCLAAHDAGITVEIKHASMNNDGDALVEGQLTCVAHLHADTTDDIASSEGDVQLEAVPFVGRLDTGEVELSALDLLAGNNPVKDSAGLVFNCVTQDNVGGDVALTLTFGSASAPDAASATLTCTHAYEDTFLLLVPYQRESRYVDEFSLVKSS